VPTAKVRLEDGLQRIRDLRLGAGVEAAILDGNAARLYRADLFAGPPPRASAN